MKNQSTRQFHCSEYFVLLLLAISLNFSTKTLAQEVYQLKDIYPGNFSSNITGFTTMQGKGYFWANDDVSDQQIWVTDGQASGTFRITDLLIPAWQRIPVTVSDSLLIFISATENSGLELFYSDGSVGSGELLIDLNPGSGSISQFGRGDGKYAYFIGKHQSSKGLYRTDGSTEGTIYLLDSVSSFRSMLRFNGSNYAKIYYNSETWLVKTDGSLENTELITRIQHSTVSTLNVGIVTLNDSIYFLKQNDDYVWGLWKTDGTADGLEQVAVLNPDGHGSPNNLVSSNGKLFFNANVGSEGSGMWISDGTEAGTTLLTNFSNQGSSTGSAFTVIKNGILFVKSEPSTGNELWFSDGTIEGTGLVKDIWPGVQGAELFLSQSILLDSILFFAASDPENGRELWRSDGTENGTYMIMDICPGDCSSAPESLHKLDENRFLFTAYTPEAGTELWIYEDQNTSSEISLPAENNVVMEVFPNPSSKTDVHLSWPTDLSPSALTLINIEGRTLFSTPLVNSPNLISISTTELQPGLYIVRLLDETNQVLTQSKLIVH